MARDFGFGADDIVEVVLDTFDDDRYGNLVVRIADAASGIASSDHNPIRDD